MKCPVVLVPGLLGTVESHYGSCRRYWSTKPAAGVELPGHGHGSPPGALPKDAVRRVCTALSRFDVPALLVGVSYLGSAVVIQAAAQVPGLVCGVVVSGYSFTARPTVLRSWLLGFSRLAASQPATGRHFTALHGKGWTQLTQSTLRALATGELHLPQCADLTRLPVPLLLANGALLENERTAVEAVTGYADVAVVPGAGHLVPQDNPRVFTALVEEFAIRIGQQRTVFHERERTGVAREEGLHGALR